MTTSHMTTSQKIDCKNLILTMNLIADHVKEVARELDIENVSKTINELLKAKRVFVMGAGRSGLVGKSFAMRLMHLGFTVFVVGESTTPAVRDDDVVIAVSGSGETPSIVSLGRIAKEIGSALIVITSNTDSTLARMADVTVRIRGRAKNHIEGYLERHMKGEYRTLTPMGTTFEVSTMIFFDSLIAELMVLLDATEDDLRKRHSVFD